MSDKDRPRLNLYSGEPQHDVFPRLLEMFPTGRMEPEAPRPFSGGRGLTLPLEFSFNGTARSVRDFLASTDTVALLVTRDGRILLEEYSLTGGQTVHWISWSVAKSFVSALVGIAVDEGRIGDVEDAIDRYAPSLEGSVYEGVRIRHVLQMSSGARWSEDYSDPDSDVIRFGDAIAAGGSLDEFVAGMTRATAPGTVCQYNSADTQALGSLLVGATGRSLTDYMQEKLYTPLGMECPGYWLLDSRGMEMAFGGLCLTARDFAKLGELYRLRVRIGGRQLVPESWVEASLCPSAAHLQVGRVLVGGHVLPLGYGYQWWIPAGGRGEFSAIGVYNQFVFVDPSRGVVIVKLSANRRYGTSPDEPTNREMETIEFLRAVAAATE